MAPKYIRFLEAFLNDEEKLVKIMTETNFLDYVDDNQIYQGIREVLRKSLKRKPKSKQIMHSIRYWTRNESRIKLKLKEAKRELAVKPEPCTEADNVETSDQTPIQQLALADNDNSKPTAQVKPKLSKRLKMKRSIERASQAAASSCSTSQAVVKIKKKSVKRKKTCAKKMNTETSSTCHVMNEIMTYSPQENEDTDDVSTSDWFMMLCSAVESLNSSYPNQKIDRGYIQETTLEPFKVIAFNEERVGIAIDTLKGEAGTTLHVGTSLDVVKKLPQNRDVSLSVALFRGKGSDHHPLVLSDMLSEKCDTSTYQHWLTLLDDGIEKISPGASIKRTESNYNLELLCALTMAFNRMSLPLYLKICHNALTEACGEGGSQKKSSSTEDLNEFLKCAPHICSFHAIYLFNKFLSQLDTSPETRKFYLFAMGCMITSDSYALTRKIFRHVCTIALNDKKTAKVNESVLYFFESFFQDRDEMDNLIKRVQSCEYQMEDVTDEPGYSPFTADFVTIAEEVNSEVTSNEEDKVNTKFCPDFLTYFIQYWSSITPLWTANILSIVVNQKLVTNESTKDFFSTIKLQGDRRWSYDKFLTTMSAQYKDMKEDYVENRPLVVRNGYSVVITSAESE